MRLNDLVERRFSGKQPLQAEATSRADSTLEEEDVIPFFAFSSEVRRIICTTNAIESLHSQVSKVIRTKGYFPSDEAAIKLIYLALRNFMAKWKRPPREWHAAKAQSAIQFGD